jgi:hypothetical protein
MGYTCLSSWQVCFICLCVCERFAAKTLCCLCLLQSAETCLHGLLEQPTQGFKNVPACEALMQTMYLVQHLFRDADSLLCVTARLMGCCQKRQIACGPMHLGWGTIGG